jgi:sulfotransferase
MRLAFLAGLPRSGSSLLASLLSQSDDLHVSPTSGVIDMMVMVRNNWMGNDAFRSQGAKAVKPMIRDMLNGMIHGYYARQFSPDRTVIDKNRAWPAYIEMMEEVLGRRVTVICTVRDILDVFRSFETLRGANPLTYPPGLGEEYVRNQSMVGRFESLMSDTGAIGMAGLRVLDAVNRGLGDRLLIVPHSRLIADPVATVAAVLLALGKKPIKVNLNSLYENRHVNDTDVWGAELHNVGEKFDRSVGARNNWAEATLPSDLVEMANTRYPGIHLIARQQEITTGDKLVSV